MASSRQEQRSEETKRAILTAAGQLFAERGFEAVTMREIAKTAGCSHTTIYIYYKDKEALLHQLSMEPLERLRQNMESCLHDESKTPDERLQAVSWTFLHFCFANRNMYNIFFMTKATQVDVAEPELEINRLRNQLFGLLRQAIGDCLLEGPKSKEEHGVSPAHGKLENATVSNASIEAVQSAEGVEQKVLAGHSDQQMLAFARIYFFTLQGILGMYMNSEEPLDHLLERLGSTFDLAIKVLLAGFKQTMKMEAELK